MEAEKRLNGETETSASTEQLNEWLYDLANRNVDDKLLEAVRVGKVKVTTTAIFSELTGRLQEYADKIKRLRIEADKYAEATLEISQLTQQKVTLVNSIFYLLKSCEGIALNADKIAELIGLLPAGGLDAKSILGLLMDGKKRETIIGNVKVIGGAFDVSWLGKIDLPALASILRESDVDFSPYENLVDVLKQRAETKSVPNG